MGWGDGLEGSGAGELDDSVGIGFDEGKEVGGGEGVSWCSMKETWKELKTRSVERSQRR